MLVLLLDKEMGGWMDGWMDDVDGNAFCIIGPLCGESTSHLWFPTQRVRNAEL